MSENPVFRIRQMIASDLDQALGLSIEEGWNQTEKDWKLLVENTDNVCIVAEKDGRIVGTATALNHSGKTAWIGMVLVDKPSRGQGAGKMLMTYIISSLGKVDSIKLDATPAGLPLYKSLGFIDEFSIYRMSTTSLRSNEYRYSGDRPKNVPKDLLPKLIEQDASIFGSERDYLLKELYRSFPNKVFAYAEGNNSWGYVFGRNGTRFNYIGPVCASSTEAAKGLVSAALEPLHSKPVAIDVLADKTDLIGWLESIGFTKQRDFVRMYLRENPHPGKPEFQYLIGGPEFG
jgi:ribosomal protein S18 acetylase RimI-like enzyme